MKKYEIQDVTRQDNVCFVVVKYSENYDVKLGDLTMSGKCTTKKQLNCR